jgi:hypothetical protein
MNNSSVRLYNPRLVKTANEEAVNVNLNPALGYNKYKATIYYQGNEYVSNILQFTAENGLNSNELTRFNMSLKLEHDKESFDSYPFYGPDSTLIVSGEASKSRSLKMIYEHTGDGTLEPNILNGATAYFYIPNNSTMLTTPNNAAFDYKYTGEQYALEGYTAYCKSYRDEFTPDNSANNLLKNTYPMELIGRFNDQDSSYEYKKPIQDWIGSSNA